MFKTESEAWTALADTLEMIKDLPVYQTGVDKNHRPTGPFVKASGLCGALIALRDDGLISNRLLSVMSERIDQLCSKTGRLYLAPRGKWKPRAKLARRFAAESQSEEARRV